MRIFQCRSQRSAVVATFWAFLFTLPLHAASPWTAIEELKRHLTGQGPLSATFVQTYLPAGFSSGEEETGRLAVALPECLRWDYDEPYPKSFLVCGERVYSWNSEDGDGKKYKVDAEREPGLDLLILKTEDLRLRYNAALEEDPDGRVVVRLLPVRPNDNVVQADLVLDPKHKNLLSLSYRDAEGNQTRFALSDYRVGVPKGSFEPPRGIAWEEE